MKNVLFLIKYAWKTERLYFIVVLIQKFFAAVEPFIDIVELGAVVYLIIQEADMNRIVKTILLYVGLHMFIAILHSFMNLAYSLTMRKSSNNKQCTYAQELYTKIPT